MRIKILALACLMVLVLFAGCNKKPNIDISIDSGFITITTEEELYNAVERWTGKLEMMAKSTHAAHDSWEAGEIDQDGYLEELKLINSEMQELKRESDLKTDFDIIGSEADHLRWNNLLLAYDNAKKALNDFLVMAPELETEQQIVDMYISKVKEGYQESLELTEEYLDDYSN